jgi:hypothetical protein
MIEGITDYPITNARPLTHHYYDLIAHRSVTKSVSGLPPHGVSAVVQAALIPVVCQRGS